MTIRWYGLVAPEGVTTGDRRMFGASALSYRDFPMRMTWQRVSAPGHEGAVVVASWLGQYQGPGGVWGAGEFLDPAIVPEVTEAIYLLEKKLIGPSVDLDPDLSYEVVEHPDRPDEFAMKVTRARVNGVTLVMSPAFHQVHITVDTEQEMTVLASAGITIATFAASGVNSAAWRKFPLAPDRATPFDHDSAVDRIAAWSGGDATKFGSAFLWKDPEGNALNRETYRLPVIDIIDNKAYLIPRAVFSAGVIMSGGHGGLYDTLSEDDRLKVQEVITDIYDYLRDQYADPRVIAPWQRGGRQGARNEADEPTRVASVNLNHWTQHASRDEFKEAMDYANSCFPTAMEVEDMISEELDAYLSLRIKQIMDRHPELIDLPNFSTGGEVLQDADVAGVTEPGVHVQIGERPIGVGSPSADGDAITAAGVLKPAGYMFANPDLRKPTPLVVDEDGHVYGHLATWRQCHMGVGNKCVMAPRSVKDYAHFKTGSVLTAEGSTVRVGKITLGTGHADKAYGVIPAVEHYDDTGTVVAVVNAGEDAHGVWVAGALVAGIEADRIAELRRSPLSGDWRRVDGNLELVAALAVNSPGFPVLHDDGDGAYSLVAAGMVTEQTEGDGSVGHERFAEVDAYLSEVSRAERAAIINSAFHDLLPPQEGCGCN